MLYYLNHPTRQDYSVKYIRPALDALRDVQRTGDIFFPRGWVGALLGGYRRMDAYQKVQDFLKDNPQYPPLLKNKIPKQLTRYFGVTRIKEVPQRFFGFCNY